MPQNTGDPNSTFAPNYAPPFPHGLAHNSSSLLHQLFRHPPKKKQGFFPLGEGPSGMTDPELPGKTVVFPFSGITARSGLRSALEEHFRVLLKLLLPCGQVQRDCFIIEEENIDYANPSSAKTTALPAASFRAGYKVPARPGPAAEAGSYSGPA